MKLFTCHCRCCFEILAKLSSGWAATMAWWCSCMICKRSSCRFSSKDNERQSFSIFFSSCSMYFSCSFTLHWSWCIVLSIDGFVIYLWLLFGLSSSSVGTGSFDVIANKLRLCDTHAEQRVILLCTTGQLTWRIVWKGVSWRVAIIWPNFCKWILTIIL